jgi:uncharacterized protein YceK
MRKALLILALLAVISGCATSKVMDCATATAYATLQCGGAMLTGGAAAEEFDEKTDANPAKEPSEKQKKKPGE